MALKKNDDDVGEVSICDGEVKKSVCLISAKSSAVYLCFQRQLAARQDSSPLCKPHLHDQAGRCAASSSPSTRASGWSPPSQIPRGDCLPPKPPGTQPERAPAMSSGTCLSYHTLMLLSKLALATSLASGLNFTSLTSC